MIAPMEMDLQLDHKATLPQPDRKTIGRTFDLLSVPGSLIEVRHSIDGKWRTRCFKNDEREQFIEYVLGLPTRTKGVHPTLNPVRSSHPNGKHTCDADIERRHWLLIDFDPGRASKRKTNASDIEKAAASELADWVREWISEAFKWRPQEGREWPSEECSWSAPIVADSGNGIHLLYPVDLPADEATDRLVDELLNQLSDLFSIAAVDRFWNAAVDVDRTVGNAGQLTKLYGSVARKGEHSLDRPWRVSGLRHVPLCVRERPVTLELLRAAVRKLKSVKGSKSHGGDPPKSRPNGHTHQPPSDWSDVDKAEWALGRLPVLDYDDNYKELNALTTAPPPMLVASANISNDPVLAGQQGQGGVSVNLELPNVNRFTSQDARVLTDIVTQELGRRGRSILG